MPSVAKWEARKAWHKQLAKRSTSATELKRLSASAMDHLDFPHLHLVPLSTLQHTLHRQLHPFDFLDQLHPNPFLPPAHPSMSQSPHSPQTSPAAPSPSDPAQPTPSDNTSSPSSAPSLSSPPCEDFTPGHQCQWIPCDKTLPDPESLYNHLCNDHIGRKSTGNLCLTCKWKDCGTTCAKRDHITSHLRGMYSSIHSTPTVPPAVLSERRKCLRAGTGAPSTVHTPLKPHVCEICKKPFKRPQDLKKHEKIHTEEHHAQHKHSKAITVSDPAYSSRVRGEGDKPRSLGPHIGHHHLPDARAKSSSVPLSDGSSGMSSIV